MKHRTLQVRHDDGADYAARRLVSMWRWFRRPLLQRGPTSVALEVRMTFLENG